MRAGVGAFCTVVSDRGFTAVLHLASLAWLSQVLAALDVLAVPVFCAASVGLAPTTTKHAARAMEIERMLWSPDGLNRAILHAWLAPSTCNAMCVRTTKVSDP